MVNSVHIPGWSASARVLSFLAILLLFTACAEPEGEAATTSTSSWTELPLVENAYYGFERPFRQDTVTVTLQSGNGLEINLEMEEGQAIVYTWSARDYVDPESLLVEFHGHTDTRPGEPGEVMFYRQANATSGHGVLVAPFTGIHAWYFRNDSDAPVVIDLEVAGYYRLSAS